MTPVKIINKNWQTTKKKEDQLNLSYIKMTE